MRLIDADALRKNMEFVCMGVMAGSDSFNAPLLEIDNAPTVQPEPHWIPCNERLPIEYDIPTEFLCTLEHKNDVYYVDLIMWNGSDWENNYTDDNKYSDYGIDKVVAWMPLPEPWRGE